MMPRLFRAIYASVTSFFFKGLFCLQQEGQALLMPKVLINAQKEQICRIK
jgi:hypothetical protein